MTSQFNGQEKVPFVFFCINKVMLAERFRLASGDAGLLISLLFQTTCSLHVSVIYMLTCLDLLWSMCTSYRSLSFDDLQMKFSLFCLNLIHN